MEEYAKSQLRLAYETILKANCAADWSLALRYAQNALVGTDDQRGKATLYIAHVLVHTGSLTLAHSYLSVYMRRWGVNLPKQYPYAVALVAQLAYRQRRFGVAIRQYRHARRLFSLCDNYHEVERATLSIAWSLARFGLVDAAFAELPGIVSTRNQSLLHSVRCFVLARSGQIEAALEEGRLAVSADRQSFDQLGTAETLVEMAAISKNPTDRFTFNKLAIEYARRQAQSVRSVLTLSHRQRGGEPLNDAETGNRGSADPHHGCSLTTGIA